MDVCCLALVVLLDTVLCQYIYSEHSSKQRVRNKRSEGKLVAV
jgi:hypothetical protein